MAILPRQSGSTEPKPSDPAPTPSQDPPKSEEPEPSQEPSQPPRPSNPSPSAQQPSASNDTPNQPSNSDNREPSATPTNEQDDPEETNEASQSLRNNSANPTAVSDPADPTATGASGPAVGTGKVSYNTPAKTNAGPGGARETITAGPRDDAEASGGLGAGAIVGSIIGGIVGAALLIFAIMFIMRKVRRNNRRRHRQKFNANTFRRSAVLVADVETKPDDGANHTFNPRPPTMIERKMNTAGVGAGPRGNALNMYQEQQQQPQMHQPYQPQQDGGYQSAQRQYGASEAYASYNVDYNNHDHVLPGPPPAASTSPAPVASQPQGRTPRAYAPQHKSALSTATTYNEADAYGGI